MYGWIWRKLPFGLPGKLTGTLVLLAAVGVLLWYVIFPWATPLLPFDDAQVGTGDQPPGADLIVPQEDEIPYNTTSNNPHPSQSPRRR